MNSSGITPLDLKVLVKPDDVEEKTAGGIILAAQTRDAEKYASTKGTLVAMGESAFREWGVADRPIAGDKVMIAKYAGLNVKGSDGAEYRLCNDEDICARLV